MAEMSLEEKVLRGQRAEQLLADPILNEAFEAVKKELFDAWATTPARDTDAREWLWMLLQASTRFESIFRGIVDTGKLAREDIRYKQGLVEKAKKLMFN